MSIFGVEQKNNSKNTGLLKTLLQPKSSVFGLFSTPKGKQVETPIRAQKGMYGQGPTTGGTHNIFPTKLETLRNSSSLNKLIFPRPDPLGKKVVEKSVQLGKDALQGVARSVATAGITAGNVPTQIANKIDKGNRPLPFGDEVPTHEFPVTRAIFGEKPVRTLGSAVQHTQKDINPFVGKNLAGAAALPLVIGSIGLDLTGAGGQKKLSQEAVEALARKAAVNKAKGVVEGDAAATLKNIEAKVGVKPFQTTESQVFPIEQPVKQVQQQKLHVSSDVPSQSQIFSQKKEQIQTSPQQVLGVPKAQELQQSTGLTNYSKSTPVKRVPIFGDETLQDIVKQESDKVKAFPDERPIQIVGVDDIPEIPKKVQVSDEGIRLAPNVRQRALMDGRIKPGEKLPKLVDDTAKMLRAPGTPKPPRGGKSMDQILQEIKLPTPVGKKVGILDYVRTPDRVLRKMGLEKEADFLRHQYDKYVLELPKNIEKITAWSKRVGKPSNERIFKFLDGQHVILNPEETKVAFEIRDWLKEWAIRLKLPQDKQISTYITHLFDDQLIQKEFDEDLAKIIESTVPGSVYNPFLQKRIGVIGYKQDTWKALDAYTKRATRKVHMDPALDQLKESSKFAEISQWNYIKKYADRVNLRPTESNTLWDNAIKQIPGIGYRFGQRPVATISRFLRQITFRGMLGANLGSALRNLSQGINTYAKLGEKYTAIGVYRSLTQGTEELKRVGVLADDFVQDRTISATKTFLQKLDKGLFFFFDTAERFNRGAAYYGAKAKALAKGMNQGDAIEFAKKVVRDTQFKYGSIDTPLAMQGDITKIFTQFLTYPVKQTEFLAEMARNKEFAGMIRYAFGSLAFVYTLGRLVNMKPAEVIPWSNYATGQSTFGVPPSLKAPVEAAKAVFNSPSDFGQERTAGEKLRDVAKSSWGLIPGGIQAKKTTEGLKTVNQGYSTSRNGKFQFPVAQTTVNKIKGGLFGKSALPEAQEYYRNIKKVDPATKEMKAVYEQVQELKAQGNNEQAQMIVNEMTEADYELYKKVKASTKRAQTMEGQVRLMPAVQQVQDLLANEQQEEAQMIVNALSEEDYRLYKLAKEKLKTESAEQGVAPKYNDGERVDDRPLIKQVLTYAKAIGTDPVTAFDRIFSGQHIRRVDSGAVIVNRMSFDDSTSYKQSLSATSDMRLDHTIPLQLGGSNDEENLKLIPVSQWSAYTPVENYLGAKLRAGTITKSEAQDLIRRFKNGEITSEEIMQ